MWPWKGSDVQCILVIVVFVLFGHKRPFFFTFCLVRKNVDFKDYCTHLPQWWPGRHSAQSSCRKPGYVTVDGYHHWTLVVAGEVDVISVSHNVVTGWCLCLWHKSWPRSEKLIFDLNWSFVSQRWLQLLFVEKHLQSINKHFKQQVLDSVSGFLWSNQQQESEHLFSSLAFSSADPPVFSSAHTPSVLSGPLVGRRGIVLLFTSFALEAVGGTETRMRLAIISSYISFWKWHESFLALTPCIQKIPSVFVQLLADKHKAIITSQRVLPLVLLPLRYSQLKRSRPSSGCWLWSGSARSFWRRSGHLVELLWPGLAGWCWLFSGNKFP